MKEFENRITAFILVMTLIILATLSILTCIEVGVFYDLRDEIRDMMYETNDISEPMESSSKIVPEAHLELIRVSEIEGSPVVPVTEEPVVEPEIEPLETFTYYDIPLSEDLQDYIFKLCENTGVDPLIALAMIGVESNYKDWVMGDNGDSYGLMQIQPKWHQKRMDAVGCDNLLDPYQNVTVGINYVAELMSTGKSTEWVLMAYNGGRTYANRKVNAGEISIYVEKVYSRMGELKELQYIIRR